MHGQLHHGAGAVGFFFFGIKVIGTALDARHAGQWQLVSLGRRTVPAQLETHPGLAIALETLDVVGAERGRGGAGIQLGLHADTEVTDMDLFMQAEYLLVAVRGGLGQAGHENSAKQGRQDTKSRLKHCM